MSDTLIDRYGPARGDLTPGNYQARMLRVRRALKREPSYTTARADALLDVAVRMHLTTRYAALFGSQREDCTHCDGTGQCVQYTHGDPGSRTIVPCTYCNGVGVNL